MGRSFIGKLLNQGPPVSYAPTAMRNSRWMSLALGTADDSTFLRSYKRMGTLWSTVSLLASSTARPEWRLYRKSRDNRVRYSTTSSGSDQRTEVLQHPALSIVNHPNDFWTRFELFEQYQQYLDLTGKNYALVGYDPRAENIPLELWPVRPDRIMPVPDQDSFLTGWLYTSPTGEQVPLRRQDVIPVKYPDPEDPYNGCGPVQSVLTDVDSSQYAAQYNRNFFYNGAAPGGVITSPVKLTDLEFDEFTDRWRESHQGLSRAHHVAILEAGMTWQADAQNAKDGEFVGLRNLSRDVVREAYGMHKVMLGVTDDVNRANAQTGEEVFYSWKIIPRLDRWKMVLNERFLPLFGPAGQGVEFDYIAPAPQNREQDNEELTAKSAAAQVLVAAGYDPHDVLEVVGLPDMDVAGQAAVPAGAIAQQAAQQAAETGAQESEPDVTARLQTIMLGAFPRVNGYHKAGAR